MAETRELSRWTAFCTALGCVVLTACTEQADGPTIALEHLGSSEPLPISGANEFAVAGPDFVCLFASYEKELACGDLSWSDTLRFGRSGEGPGELGDYGYLVRVSRDGVGFVDLPNDRISLFTRQGYAGQLPLPQLFYPASDISQDGTYAGHANLITQRPGEIALLESRAENAELVRDVRLKIDSILIDEPKVVVAGATQLRNGEFILKTANEPAQRLLRYNADGSPVGQLRMPEFPSELPDARDIEISGEELYGFPQGSIVDRMIRNFANRPLTRLVRTRLYRTVQLDPEGRVLVLTTHRSPTGTYVEVYSGLDYAGRAHLRGRVLAIQVVNSILIALTEEMPTDDFIPKRRLEWYGFGSGSPVGH